MDDIQIIDNFLDKKYFKELQEIVFSHNFGWSRSYNEEDGFQFVHQLFLTLPLELSFRDFEELRSPFFNKFVPVLKELKVSSLMRIKANLLSRTEKRVIHGWHTDIIVDNYAADYPNLKNGKTSILYMNTNNGVTIFEDSKKEVESIENRMAIFPTTTRHTGTTNTDPDIPDRCVINFNYF